MKASISMSEFESLGLHKNILRGVFSYGYTTPSPIQKRAIPSIAAGKHAVIQSKNGTGKTATFLLGAMQRIEPEIQKKHLAVLVFSPTRDLALQTCAVASSLGKFLGVKSACAVGGQSLGEDLKGLSAPQGGCHILCGTPGRVLQLIKEAPKSFAKIKTVVFDEADRTLDVGTGVQVQRILEALKVHTPQFVFVSATLPASVKETLSLFLKDPEMFLIPQEKLALSQIAQKYVIVPESEKFDMVCTVFSTLSVSQAVIFVRTKEAAVALEQKMRTHEFPVTALHSDLSQPERNKRLDSFFKSKYRILISTDIASRGIDAAHVNLVINYDLPSSSEEYLHRIGRGGRFGKVSTAVTFAAPHESSKVHTVCEVFGASLCAFSASTE
ncbi:ATP-dependent RNA helicase [Nematocida sp. AWRm77]|nr:ATP-dependent RNA helicase [Nematocida sp. AWRm77]